ncbi:Hypothetical predicted protein [Cloeon dipterum]|uniref:Uncharacterized protein n=1 Tax=Cloeon dipterum TaxID=197152 RepID=A0A8S1BT35_9INSE|nr:Hypothetical predicted protein [Cloeon dipterum]
MQPLWLFGLCLTVWSVTNAEVTDTMAKFYMEKCIGLAQAETWRIEIPLDRSLYSKRGLKNLRHQVEINFIVTPSTYEKSNSEWLGQHFQESTHLGDINANKTIMLQGFGGYNLWTSLTTLMLLDSENSTVWTVLIYSPFVPLCRRTMQLAEKNGVQREYIDSLVTPVDGALAKEVKERLADLLRHFENSFDISEDFPKDLIDQHTGVIELALVFGPVIIVTFIVCYFCCFRVKCCQKPYQREQVDSQKDQRQSTV